jgi:hypothetical protein
MLFWGLVIIMLGVGLIIGSYFNWDWFMKIWKDADWVEALGRNGARILYGIIGFLGIVIGALIVFGVIKP